MPGRQREGPDRPEYMWTTIENPPQRGAGMKTTMRRRPIPTGERPNRDDSDPADIDIPLEDVTEEEEGADSAD